MVIAAMKLKDAYSLDPLEEEMATHFFLPRESHGQRSLAGYSPWGRKKSDMTERLILILDSLEEKLDQSR